jgi:hypothetical protein
MNNIHRTTLTTWEISLKLPKEYSQAVYRRRIDNQWPKEKGQTIIYKTLHRKLKIDQHESKTKQFIICLYRYSPIVLIKNLKLKKTSRTKYLSLFDSKPSYRSARWTMYPQKSLRNLKTLFDSSLKYCYI